MIGILNGDMECNDCARAVTGFITDKPHVQQLTHTDLSLIAAYYDGLDDDSLVKMILFLL